MPAPSADVQAAIIAPSTKITRRVEIYESNGTTLWATVSAPDLLDGSVNVDYGRDERRTIDLTLGNTEQELRHYPGGFWYDKVIKTYRGIEYSGGTWETQTGEFVIDSIESQNFPHTIKVSGRDYVKRLLTSKFVQTTSFAQGALVTDTIRTIATNGGITKFNLYDTENKALGKTFTFERGTERWRACRDIAVAYGFELFFDAYGFLTLRKFNDPALAPETITFRTGPEIGNLVSYRKRTGDTRIYNHIVVVGESTQGGVPVWAEAVNDEPSSPTRRGAIGDRVYQYVSSFITTQAQAQNTADNFLRVHALEEFDLSVESIVFAWLEAGDIAVFEDPDPNPGDPTRFLLTSFDIPFTLGASGATGKCVQVIG